MEVYFSLDEETKRLVKKLGYIPKGCYSTTKPNVFIREHAEKNREIVKREILSQEREIDEQPFDIRG